MEENDPDAAFLLVGSGCELPDLVALKYGIIVVQEEKAIEASPENKAIQFPPENKRSKKSSK